MDRIPKIVIDDFSGGRDSFTDQLLIDNNCHASASQNVWAPTKSLIPTPGIVLQASTTASGSGSPIYTIYYDATTNTAQNLYYTVLNGTSGADVVYASNGLTDSLTPIGYNAGTISVSGASLISATGNGTSWLGNILAGDSLSINTTSSASYFIKSVEDNAHLTLLTPVSTAVPTGSAYLIQPHTTSSYQYTQSFVSLNGYICIGSPDTDMVLYNGVTAAHTNVPPHGYYWTAYQGYVFTARTLTAQSRVYWSNLGDPTTWGSNNFIDIDLGNNGHLTGIFPAAYELLCFKSSGLYKILGNTFDPTNPTYSVVRINTPADFSFNSNWTVAVFNGKSGYEGSYFYEGAIVFYGNGRIYKYLPGTTYVTDISPKIIRDLPTLFSSLRDPDYQKGIAFNNYYVLQGLRNANATSTADNTYTGFIIDKNQSAYMLNMGEFGANPASPIGPGGMTILQQTTTRPQLLTVMAGGNDGKVFSWDFIGPSYGKNYYLDSVSSASSINAIWQSKEFNIRYGTFKNLVVYLAKQTTGVVTASWSIDQAAYVSTTIDMTQGRGNMIRAVLDVNQKGSTIQLKMAHNAINETFKIYAIEVRHEESEMERLR